MKNPKKKPLSYLINSTYSIYNIKIMIKYKFISETQ